MNILCAVTYYAPYISGLTRFAHILAEELAKKHRVTVLSMMYDKKLPSEEVKNSVRIIRARPFFAIRKGFLSLEWAIWAIREVVTAESVIIHLPQPEAWWLAFVARVCGKRVISVYHCEIVVGTGILSHSIQKSVEMFHILTLFLSHKILVTSIDFAQHSRLVKPFISKTKEVPPPIELVAAPKRCLDAVSRKLKRPNRVLVGFVGRIATEKGIEYLLEAIPLMTRMIQQEVVIVLVGPDSPVGEAEYRQYIDSLYRRYRDSIIRLGNVDRETLAAVYENLDILVLPSINTTEAFGMVQIEAMSRGVPVIATDLPGVRVMVRQTGMGVIIPPRDSKAIARAVQTILDDPQTFHSRGRLRIDKRYVPSYTVAAITSLLYP